MFVKRFLLALLLPLILGASAPYQVAHVIQQDDFAICLKLNNLNQVVGVSEEGNFFWSQGTGFVYFEDVDDLPHLNNSGKVLIRKVGRTDELSFWDPQSGYEKIELPSGQRTAFSLALNDSGCFSTVDAESWLDVKNQYVYQSGQWLKLPNICYITKKMNSEGKLLFTRLDLEACAPALFDPLTNNVNWWELPDSCIALDCSDDQVIIGNTEDRKKGWVLDLNEEQYRSYTNFLPRVINNHQETLGVHPDEEDSHSLFHTFLCNIKTGKMTYVASLIEDKSIRLLRVTDINDKGWICGFGLQGEDIVGVILKPKAPKLP